MRARALALGLLSSAAVLAVGWQLGTQGQTSVVPDAAAADAGAPAAAGSPSPSPSTSSSASPSTAQVPSSAEPTPAPAATAAPAGASGTFTGSSVQTRYGAVQVQVTVESGTITDVTALHLTDDDQRSVSISNRAAPVLRQEVLAAQSADVHGVSGATYTSEGYLKSLQSALDQAGL